jgi:hypothetical protein
MSDKSVIHILRSPFADDPTARLQAFRWVERLGGPYAAELRWDSRNAAPSGQLRGILGEAVVMRIQTAPGQERVFHARVANATWMGTARGDVRWQATLVPPAWLSARRTHQGIVTGPGREAVIRHLIEQLGGGEQLDLRFRQIASQWQHLVQFGWCDLEMLLELLAAEGLTYYFQHHLDQLRWVITDAWEQGPMVVTEPQELSPTAGGTAVVAASQSESLPWLRPGDDWVAGLELDGWPQVSADVARLGTVGDQLEWQVGRSRQLQLAAGLRAAVDSSNAEEPWVFIDVEHLFEADGRERALGDPVPGVYSNRFRAIRTETATERPARRVCGELAGHYPARVVGAHGDRVVTESGWAKESVERLEIELWWGPPLQENGLRAPATAADKVDHRQSTISVPLAPWLCRPEDRPDHAWNVGDWVWLAFQAGDARYPWVVGSIAGGGQPPPVHDVRSTARPESSAPSWPSSQLSVASGFDETTNLNRICRAGLLERVKGSWHQSIDQEWLHRSHGWSMDVSGQADLRIEQHLAVEVGGPLHMHGKGGMVLQADERLCLRAGENFISLGPEGIFIQGTLVGLNSGGERFEGVVCSPRPPRLPPETPPAAEGEDANRGPFPVSEFGSGAT